MHELPRNQPAVRRKWMKFVQFKRADFLAAPHHAHLCSEHFSCLLYTSDAADDKVSVDLGGRRIIKKNF